MQSRINRAGVGWWVPWPPDADEPVPGARKAIGSLRNVLQAALELAGTWRVGVASTIGVYGGATAQSPLREDTPLPQPRSSALARKPPPKFDWPPASRTHPLPSRSAI